MKALSGFNSITYIGHATLLLEIDGVRILTDPLLRDWVYHLKRRGPKVPASLYDRIDAVLISHLHRDHFDVPSLRKLGRDINLIVPVGAAAYLQKQGFHNTLERQPGDTTRIGGVTIQVTHAEHHGSISPGGASTACLGYLVSGSQRVYFPGDTDLFPGMADLAADLDVALLPVWGWGPNLGPGHMNPRRAAEALTLLRPRIAIPIHWGTLYPRGLGWFRPYLMTQPPQLFHQEASRQAPHVEVYILAAGSSLRIPIA